MILENPVPTGSGPAPVIDGDRVVSEVKADAAYGRMILPLEARVRLAPHDLRRGIMRLRNAIA